MSGLLRIGTSGIVLPGPKKDFPLAFQSRTRLEYYSSLFNTIEINSTFYKIPRQSTFEKWSSEVSEDFQFTCKLPRVIIHNKGLSYQTRDIETFMEACKGINKKKGCLLAQFPASIKAERSEQLEEMLRYLISLNVNPKWRISVEFRDSSWYHHTPILNKLKDLNVSVVVHDMSSSKTPWQLAGDPVYLRFHGQQGNYRGTYPNEVLTSYASMIRNWLLHRDVYVYFNNTIGEAFNNAQHLIQLI